MNAIELRNLSKTYPLFKLDQITLDIKQGYITGLIGPNGAGKSTLISLITGLIRPDSGSIKTLGKEMPAQEINVKERIGIVSDECFYYEHLTIREMKSMIAPFYKKWDEKQFNNYLEQFELSPKRRFKNCPKA